MLHRMAAWLRGHRGEIIYYTCVLGALTIIAVGAQEYRQGRSVPEPVVLPAVELAQSEPEEPMFHLPEGMQMLQSYSAQPRWNEQHLCWQAHPAADYASADGLIHAFSDGTILELGKSAVLGGYVLIESGEAQLKYCGIAPEEELQPGATIRKGEILGSASDTIPGEVHLGDHLHLEAYRQGESIDPEDLFSPAD